MIAKARTLPIAYRIHHAAWPVTGGSTPTRLCTQAQNNLLYMALSNLDAAIFQVSAAIAQTCRVRGSVVLSGERACVRACVRARARLVVHGAGDVPAQDPDDGGVLNQHAAAEALAHAGR